jgi:hypothetical protein
MTKSTRAHNRHNLAHHNRNDFNALEPAIISARMAPEVSVDKVKAYVPHWHNELITGGYDIVNGRPKHKPFWINVAHEKIPVLSHSRVARRRGHYLIIDELLVDFNPATHEHGHNLGCFNYPLQWPLIDIIPLIARSSEKVVRSKVDAIRRRAGAIELSYIDLCGDFIFPSEVQRQKFWRELHRWKWHRNQHRDDQYETTLYFHQTHWHLKVYLKDDEIAAHHQDWPDDVKAQCDLRIRFEVQIKREDLRRLGKRLDVVAFEREPLDLSKSDPWQPPLYSRAFDYYMRRLQRIGNTKTPPKGVVPVYGLLAGYGAIPVHPRLHESTPRWAL